ncbi:hypothetical protein NP233_g11005 [Leucocoprinus birnbaumii]|uniref:Uncharacterized protein n=1 Tax=Leucocoprinus birnbaumii TaxID=56174 RepID=A0AAD5YPC1_9AGAR|nr:hypothetical protein NP233_g11005 [Leucocoprinus birnbaumii]
MRRMRHARMSGRDHLNLLTDATGIGIRGVYGAGMGAGAVVVDCEQDMNTALRRQEIDALIANQKARTENIRRTAREELRKAQEEAQRKLKKSEEERVGLQGELEQQRNFGDEAGTLHHQEIDTLIAKHMVQMENVMRMTREELRKEGDDGRTEGGARGGAARAEETREEHVEPLREFEQQHRLGDEARALHRQEIDALITKFTAEIESVKRIVRGEARSLHRQEIDALVANHKAETENNRKARREELRQMQEEAQRKLKISEDERRPDLSQPDATRTRGQVRTNLLKAFVISLFCSHTLRGRLVHGDRVIRWSRSALIEHSSPSSSLLPASITLPPYIMYQYQIPFNVSSIKRVGRFVRRYLTRLTRRCAKTVVPSHTFNTMAGYDLMHQCCVALYLDGPKSAGNSQTRRQIQASFRQMWPQFVEQCEALGIEGPICGIIINLNHLSPGQRRPEDEHSTIRLFDGYNYGIATLHAPMPLGHEDLPWWTVAKDNWRDGLDFRMVFKKGMVVRVSASSRVRFPSIRKTIATDK